MHVLPVGPFLGQGWVQIGELLLAFALSASIGIERQVRGKSAGLRTQALVGTTAALLLLVSKYGFFDVLSAGTVVVDPSRIAAQVVSGIGFLGAGLILSRRGVVRGLTTAASVWETAAIGMAAGAGLWLLAIIVTVLHFVTVVALSAITRRIRTRGENVVQLEVAYSDGQGALRQIISTTTGLGWRVQDLRSAPAADDGTVSVTMRLVGSGSENDLLAALASLDGVRRTTAMPDDEWD